jgi:DnaJ homolog subfamily C member 25
VRAHYRGHPPFCQKKLHFAANKSFFKHSRHESGQTNLVGSGLISHFRYVGLVKTQVLLRDGQFTNMAKLNGFILFFLISVTVTNVNAFLEGIYCGKENCYDVLGVTRDTAKKEIAQSYRKLAKMYHPDRQSRKMDEAEKQLIVDKFKLVAQAYEILKDDETRTDYDYMLDNPDVYYAHYYRYYKKVYAAKIDVRLVLIVTISIISLIQYYSGWQRYDSAIKYFATVPKYRNQAMRIIEETDDPKYKLSFANKKGSKNKMSKQEQREETEKVLLKVIEEKMDIQGAYAKPEIRDILWVQLLISPYTIFKYATWYSNWVWNFNVLKKEYGDEEKLYLIRKYLKMGQHQFNAIDDYTINDYLDMELWVKENFDEWKAIEEEEQKKKLAESSTYKSYRRYMKKNGPGRLTFED